MESPGGRTRWSFSTLRAQEAYDAQDTTWAQWAMQYADWVDGRFWEQAQADNVRFRAARERSEEPGVIEAEYVVVPEEQPPVRPALLTAPREPEDAEP